MKKYRYTYDIFGMISGVFPIDEIKDEIKDEIVDEVIKEQPVIDLVIETSAVDIDVSKSTKPSNKKGKVKRGK